MKQRVAPGPAMSLALIQASSFHAVMFLDEFRHSYKKELSKNVLKCACVDGFYHVMRWLFSQVCVNTGWTCMWRSEVSPRCCSSGTVTLLLWDRVLHWSETHQVGKPARPGIHLSLPPQGWDYRCMLPCQLFYVAFGDHTEVIIAG